MLICAAKALTLTMRRFTFFMKAREGSVVPKSKSSVSEGEFKWVGPFEWGNSVELLRNRLRALAKGCITSVRWEMDELDGVNFQGQVLLIWSAGFYEQRIPYNDMDILFHVIKRIWIFYYSSLSYFLIYYKVEWDKINFFLFMGCIQICFCLLSLI